MTEWGDSTGSDASYSGDNQYYYDNTSVSDWRFLLRALHGGAMVMTWAIFTSTGVIIARYCRHKHWWIHVHRRMQTAGFLLTLPLTFLSFATKESNAHYVVIHSQLGLTVSILSFCQGILGGLLFGAISFGPCINFPLKVRRSIRIVVRFLHHWNGRFVVSLALAVIFLGLLQLGLPEAFQITYGLYLGMGFLGVVYLEYQRFLNPPSHVKGAHRAVDDDDRPTHYEEELQKRKTPLVVPASPSSKHKPIALDLNNAQSTNDEQNTSAQNTKDEQNNSAQNNKDEQSQQNNNSQTQNPT